MEYFVDTEDFFFLTDDIGKCLYCVKEKKKQPRLHTSYNSSSLKTLE